MNLPLDSPSVFLPERNIDTMAVKVCDACKYISTSFKALDLSEVCTSENCCREGDLCPYLHNPDLKQSENRDVRVGSPPTARGSRPEAISSPTQRRYQAPLVDRSKIVARPVPTSEASDPRTFQINQIKRRYSASEIDELRGTKVMFKLVPSDPDFPFEMGEGLDCMLFVPTAYPADKPHLRVTHKDMERGFQINIEKGFDTMVTQTRNMTLLGLLNNLDKQLETLLAGEKASTIKIVRNAHLPEIPELEPPPPSPPLEALKDDLDTAPKYTPRQLSEAEGKRKAEVRQLEARLGRQPMFEKSRDGQAYMIPLEPRRRTSLPVPLQKIRSIELLVPELYPLESARIRLFGVPAELAKNTEGSFLRYVKSHNTITLMGQINYLSSSMHILAATAIDSDQKDEASSVEVSEPETKANLSLQESKPEVSKLSSVGQEDEDRSHIHYIPRPPEWLLPSSGDQESDSESPYSSDEASDLDSEEDVEVHGDTPISGPERGILMSFPFLELHGLELLELTSLAITVRCTRCKDTLDIERLQRDMSKEPSCRKCAQTFKIGFRPEMMHTNSVRAGYLDLDGCTVVDMLPSLFIPTCANCSAIQPLPGVTSVRGEASMTICRDCHHRMSFKIAEVKFLQVSATTKKNFLPARKKVRENLGISAGTELPNRGRCEHYRKSYRWFRFSCCQKVFACDRCHDFASDHINEHANRMICGWCSREQLYRPETCAFCRNNVVGKRAGGFWEGGKGTRDKNLMSRKDPRKWKRRKGLNARVGGSSTKS